MANAIEQLTAALVDRYKIERELGQGGMAMVYLALDLRHDRHVAIKVLRPELAAVIGAERFLREIKTIATLQHSHILGLIDSGEVNGTAYYVMPYVDGESLRDRLNREKQLPVGDAVRIATEVASALDYAHRHGVIHRDIKPENVLLHDGTALVADFGIALAVSNVGATRMTETGMSLGTPHYMSPEQAMGEREITARSDIYALGAITYEMLVGEPPFTGPTAQAIVAKVMTEEPRPLIPKRRTIPPQVESAVLIALQKVPADRFSSAADFAGALTGRIITTATGVRPSPGATRPPLDWRIAGGIALLSLLLGIVGSRYLLARPQEPGRLGRFAIQIQPVRSLATGFSRQIAISSDGGVVGFVGRGPRGNQVYLRSMADTTARPVPGTEGAQSLFFSPDSRQIGFWLSTQRLMRIPVEGGTPIVVADSAGSFGSWNDDGSVVYTDPIGRELMIALPDGATRRVVRSDSSVFLGVSSVPGSQTVLATQLTGGRTQMRVVAVSLSDGRIQDIGLTDVLMAKALPEGYLIYQRRAGGPLLAATFDFKRLRIVGEGRTVSPATRVTYRVVPQWDASGSALVFYPPAPMQLVLVDRSGRTTPLAEDPRTYHHPRFSPDGRLIALDITDQGRDVWMADTRDRRMWRLTVGEVANDPFWSPDGRRVAYTAVRGGVRGVFFRAADGSGTPDSIYMDQNDHSSGAWSPDGSALVVSTAGQSGLWRIPLNGSGAAAAIPGSRASEAYPALSRDGRWLAFVSDESGRQEVYVRPFVGAGGRVQVSVNGGSEPVFTRDGQELIYEEHSETSQLISARIRTAPTFEVLSRTPLFDVTNYANAEDHANYDVSPDGRSFAMIRNAQASQIQLILNWAAQLGRE